jgi:hypothetical protein
MVVPISKPKKGFLACYEVIRGPIIIVVVVGCATGVED